MTHFLSTGNRHINISLKRKKYKVDDRAKKAVWFFVACQANPATKVKVTEAMRVKGYANSKATNLTLQQQVQRAVEI